MIAKGVAACPKCHTGFVAHQDDEYFCLSCGFRVAYDEKRFDFYGQRGKKGARNGRLGYA